MPLRRLESLKLRRTCRSAEPSACSISKFLSLALGAFAAEPINSIWREEGDVDVFIVRPWKHEIPEDNSSDEDEDTESEDDAMDILGI